MRTALIVAVVLISAPALAADPTDPVDRSGIYYCRPFATAGMAHDVNADTWTPSTFKTPDDGISIRVKSLRKDGPDYEKNWVYSVNLKTSALGEYRTCMNQEFGFEIVSPSDRVECRWIADRYIFDLDYLKYEAWGEGSYMQPKDNQTFGTPYIQLGKCEKVD
ncbi:hypothetical protein [Rhizobium sp. BK379]|uniref:hypothetical protein n=1 Tax=Rhizobium sp. BK379 TaxID=2587059 RepID=UPI00161F268F|nr:hypothetical protein [Rhizobium sp. BK379]MBB3445887.1 hypothetical protein [Rhizobium sp. BK379]